MERWIGQLWTVIVTLGVLAPVLRPGYVLSYDMVFTPRQSLLPWMFGLGGGLPRAVPQDVIVGLIAGPISGQVLQKTVLVGTLLLAGLGVNRLLRGQSIAIRLAAVTLFIWNPYVAERLIVGHWGLLLAFAVMPWLAGAVWDARFGQVSGLSRVVLWSALGSIVPTGGVLMFALAVPAWAYRSRLSVRARLSLVGALVLVNAPWWLPAVLNPNATASDSAGASAFSLHAQGWWGPLITALGQGGIWNNAATLPTRSLLWTPLVALALVGLAVCGFSRVIRLFGRAISWWLAGLAAVGVIFAVLGAWAVTQPVMGWVITTVPAGGILRDGQKLLAPLTLVVAVAAPLGLARLAGRIRSAEWRTATVALLVVMPLVALPDLAWGAFGRLASVSYPQSWDEVRSAMASGESGAAISVPWAPFRQYSWNGGRTLLDPAPRYMTRTVLVDENLPVRVDGKLVVVSGDNPQSQAVGELLASRRLLAQSLPELGVAWVIEQTDQPRQLDPDRLAGMTLVIDQPGLRLWQTPTSARQLPEPKGSTLVALTDGAAAGLVVAFGAMLATRRFRGARSRRHTPSGSGQT